MGNTALADHSLDRDWSDTTPPPTPESWEPFERLKRLCPSLQKLADNPRYQTPPPRPLERCGFLALAACFADPTKREILRALILELLADDLADLLAEDGGETT